MFALGLHRSLVADHELELADVDTVGAQLNGLERGWTWCTWGLQQRIEGAIGQPGTDQVDRLRVGGKVERHHHWRCSSGLSFPTQHLGVLGVEHCV